MNAHLLLSDDGAIIAELIAKPYLLNRVLEAQKSHEIFFAIVSQNREGKETEFLVNEDGFLYYRDQVCVPNDDELKKSILEEAHSRSFAIHLGSTKMYQDLKTSYWWFEVKRDVSEFVTKCIVCQKVKAEHQVPSGLLQLGVAIRIDGSCSCHVNIRIMSTFANPNRTQIINVSTFANPTHLLFVLGRSTQI